MTSVAEMAAAHAKLERAASYLAWIRTLAACKGDGIQARAVLAAKDPRNPLPAIMAKSAVSAGRVDGATWGSQTAELRQASAAFVELTRGRSILGRLTGFRRVPFRVKIPRGISAALVGWTAEGAPTIVSAPTLDQLTFENSKITGICVISSELANLSDPAAESLINNDLIGSTASFVDQAFLDPTIAAVGEAPASITNGVTPVTATGTTEAALKADIASLVQDLIDGGSDLENVTLIMSKVMALRIAAMDVGEGLGVNGGTLLGLPVVTTISAAMVEGGSPGTERIVAVDTSLILLGDDGVETSVSREGTLQMNTTPDSPATASTELVSLWQHNLVAVKLVRFIRFERARAGAAAYVSGAAYGS
jgi:hypothetical protein